MNKIQNNKIRTYHSVSGVLEKHHRIWSAYPVLVKTAGEFSSILEEIKKVEAARKADTRTLAALFRSCDQLLGRKLDRLMQNLQEEHQLFHDAYFNARKITDL